MSNSEEVLNERTVYQRPLSRLGRGPALLLIVEHAEDPGGAAAVHHSTLDPRPLKKWAEEGYAVAQVTLSETEFEDDVKRAVAHLTAADRSECTGGPIALITYISGHAPLERIATIVYESSNGTSPIAAVVSYGALHDFQGSSGFGEVPYLAHIAKNHNDHSTISVNTKMHSYPKADLLFGLPDRSTYQPSSAGVAHTRTLSFLKPLMGGPYFDLEAIWEEHTKFEFEERSVEKTMATMVDEPYVNHIPTLTGGIGRARLSNFYEHHFIFANPDDTELDLVSRTVGIDRVIDEFLFKFTHNQTIDWLLPGIPPTGKHASVPFTSVVNIRGDKLFHEHISWDQATLLRQLGLLPEFLPFPYSLTMSDGGLKDAGPGKRYEFKLPVAGVETALKLADESAVESNQMIMLHNGDGYSVRVVDVS